MAEETKTESKDLSKNVAKLVDSVSELTVLELSELVEALQDKFGVSAVAMAAPAAAAGASEGEAADEGGNKTVVITAIGDNKIAIIKAIRAIDQSLGLKDAKDMTENLPAEVLKDAGPDDVKDAKAKLEEAGATVELK